MTGMTNNRFAWRFVGRCLQSVIAVMTVAALTVICIPSLREQGIRIVSGRPLPLSLGSALNIDRTAFSGADFTAVLFGRSSCEACVKAAPFLNDLRAELTKDGSMSFKYVSTDSLSKDELSFASTLGLAEKDILAAPSTLRAQIRQTPTLVVVDRKGIVQFINVAGLRSPGQVVELAERTRKALKRKSA